MNGPYSIPLIRAGIDTYRQPVLYMREDCHLCRSEGFSALTRVKIELNSRSIIATLNVVTTIDWLPAETAALSDAAWTTLLAVAGDRAILSHPEPPASASIIRNKAYGSLLDAASARVLIGDIVAHRLSDLDLAAFVTACAGDRLDIAETIALTRAMQDAGQTLDWGSGLVLDKHCVGGLPGNRTTPIVVAIVAAAGFRIPKTSTSWDARGGATASRASNTRQARHGDGAFERPRCWRCTRRKRGRFHGSRCDLRGSRQPVPDR